MRQRDASAGNAALSALFALAFVAGAGLVAASAWLAPIREGEQALADGKLEAARERFAAAEARFEKMPALKQALPAAYAESVANQLFVLYKLDRHDALLEKAATAPSTAPVHFWSGSALFAKARKEEAAEARLSLLARAGDEFKKALERAPDDFDTKFDYELTQRLLQELKKQPKTPPTQLMQLLRPKPKEGQPPAKRVG